jgi:hypothetical protein
MTCYTWTRLTPTQKLSWVQNWVQVNGGSPYALQQSVAAIDRACSQQSVALPGMFYLPAGQAVAPAPAPAPSQPTVIVLPQMNDNFWWGAAAGLAIGFFVL